MRQGPLRILAHGYGLAALGGAAMALTGFGPVGVALAVWIGGALATLALSARVAHRGARETATAEDAAAASLAPWEADREADAAAARSNRRKVG